MPKDRRRVRAGPVLPRLGRFAVVGASGVVVNNAALLVLHGYLGVALLPATAAAVELAILHNYILHELWTFRRARPSGRRFVYFGLAALATLALNVAVVQALTRLGMYYLFANLFGITAGFAVNFAVSSTWIWSERTNGARHPGRCQPDLAGVDPAGRAFAVPHDLHVGPARSVRARAGTRCVGWTALLLHRDRSSAARGGGHPGDHRPRCRR
jgi:putative flippase GtrA